MKIKIALCLLYTCVNIMYANAQQQLDCDSSEYSVFRMHRGQKFDVKCDTLYVLNKFTFNWMYTAYNDYRNQNLLLSQYTLLNDSISNMYDAQLDTQRLYFDTLNGYFDKLTRSADQLIKNSTANINTISGNLDTIESQIHKAKDNIDSASKNIIEAKKHIRKHKFKWAAIGFGSGVVLTLIGTLFQ